MWNNSRKVTELEVNVRETWPADCLFKATSTTPHYFCIPVLFVIICWIHIQNNVSQDSQPPQY